MDLLQNIRITQITSLQTIHNPKGKTARIENRKSYGLCFCIDGKITYTLAGKRCRSTPEYAVILPKGQTYTMHTDRGGSFPLINFDCTGLPNDRFLLLPVYTLAPYLRQFEQMQQLRLFHGSDLKLLGIFYEMLGELSSGQGDPGAPLRGALRYLEEHISDPELTNSILARQIGFSEVYFRKLFTRQYGISPKQYITQTRLRKARQLLSDTTLSVTAVAEACGFSSVYHFSRSFRDHVGVSPSEYAQQNRIDRI